jgi:exodeoxyribonuclease-3
VLTVATANVNGVRAAARRGMPAWLAERRPDVLCLQEVRTSDDQLGSAVGDGWHVVHEEAAARGRAGVAVLSRLPPVAARVGLGNGPGAAEFAGCGRWVELDVEPPLGGLLTVASAYAHTGEAETPRQDEKHRFLDAVLARMRELSADGRQVLVCGDLNVAHREADLRNWTGNVKKAGFLPAERAWLDRLLTDHGWVDVHRRLAGDGPGPYTWWSWRGRAFDNDAGWRIDYQLATPGLAARAVKAEVDRAPTYARRWSDHAPVVVCYDL